MSPSEETAREEVRRRRGRAVYQTVGLVAGPALAALLLALPAPEGLSAAGWRTAALGLWAEATGRDRRARQWLERALAADPDNPRTRRLQAALAPAPEPVTG